MLGQGAYVLGIEPANCHVEGRARERERGTLEFLQPGEKRNFYLELAGKAKEQGLQSIMEMLAADEMKHSIFFRI